MSEFNKKILLNKVNSYKRNHIGEFYGDSEKSKVRRDKMILYKVDKEVNKALPLDITNMTDKELDYYDEVLYEAKKARGNANTHNKRYKNLSKHNDFQ